jgi:DNA-binding response OmpR family regulator
MDNKIKVGLNHYRDNVKFDAYTYADPRSALTEFEPNFYDLMLTDRMLTKYKKYCNTNIVNIVNLIILTA